MRHLIDPLDFTVAETQSLLDLADRILADPAAYQNVATRKKLATLFYEPSTRTRLSFEAAMLNLGGQVLGFPDAGVSSASKGETVADTIRIISCYADIAAMRPP
ncbi:MAG: aspartate carbamoyltransferase, partial [Gemmiger sp.]|nr:aspartate carbamoyltransferase [Gemmiger sp.]